MIIRRAVVEDAPSISRLNFEVQRLHASALPHLFKSPPQADFALLFMQEQLADPNNYFYICQQDGEDVGYVFARLLHRPENAFFHAWKYFYIDHIAVTPGRRRSGCGRQLVETIVELAQQEGVDTISLETWAFNHDAHAFFSQVGFETANMRMWRQVTPP